MNKNKLQSVSKLDKNHINFIDKITRFSGFFKLVEYVFRYPRFNGEMSKEIHRLVVERGNAAILLAYDPRRDEVVLVEQIRVGAFNEDKSPWLIEVVAGIIDEGEDAETTARREAQEEAGVIVKRCKKALSYLASPGGSTERLTVFIGEVDASEAGGIHGLEEEGEDILVHVVPRGKAYQWIAEGVIDNAGAVIALQWLELHYRELQKEWTEKK